MKTKIVVTLLFSVLLLPLAQVVHAANFGSSYATILKEHCSTLPSRAGERGTVHTCPSFKDIGINIVNVDNKQHIVLSRNNQQYPLIFNDTTTKDIARVTLGSTIEWRQKLGRPSQVIGMIMRVNVFSTNKKKRSYLVVNKITDQNICIVGSVPPQRNQNLQARRMVDSSANKPCISTPLSQDAVRKALVGSWVEPVPGRSREVQGFTLYDNGQATAINMKTLRYKRWRVEGNKLIFTVQNVVNSWASDEDESYTFAFCEQKLCLTAGGITQAYSKQGRSNTNRPYNDYRGTQGNQYNDRTNNQYNNTNGSRQIDIGFMRGRQYADHCSFLKPADLRNFVYKDDNSWRFLFSSNPSSRSARMLLNGRIENLELISLKENFAKKTVRERYRVVGQSDTIVTLKKTETNNFRNYKRYQGRLVVKRNGAKNEIDVLGDCRL